MQTDNEKHPAIGQRITEFIQRNRKPISAMAVVVVVAMIGSVIALVVADVARGRAIAAVEDLGVRYEALIGFIGVDAEVENGADNGEAEELSELIADLLAFASRRSGYAGGRAWSMLGSIYGRQGEWAEAEAAWLAAARATSRSHMAPIALFNAGAAAEEQGRLEQAIYHYEKSVSAPAGFFAAARAQFSIGRLWEALGDTDAAIQAYRDVIFGWPHDAAWTNLAHSRIIALETMAWRLDEPVIRPEVEDPAVTWPMEPWFDFEDGGLALDFAD